MVIVALSAGLGSSSFRSLAHPGSRHNNAHGWPVYVTVKKPGDAFLGCWLVLFDIFRGLCIHFPVQYPWIRTPSCHEIASARQRQECNQDGGLWTSGGAPANQRTATWHGCSLGRPRRNEQMRFGKEFNFCRLTSAPVAIEKSGALNTVTRDHIHQGGDALKPLIHLTTNPAGVP